MYTFVNAVCLARTIGSQWLERDLSDILVFDIFNTYTRVYLILHSSVLNKDIYVDMETLRAEYSSYGFTLDEMLAELGNRTLVTVNELPDTAVKYVKYSDAFRAEYKMKLCIAGSVYPDNTPETFLTDVELTRDKYKTDLTLIHSHTLVSVNGFIHRTDTDGTKAFVYDAGTTMRKSKDNHIGIISFLDIGKLEKEQLKPENIYAQSKDGLLKEKILFNVDTPLDNKCYMLILGGYMVLPESGVFWRSGEHTFTLDLNRLYYLERLVESRQYISLESLGLTVNDASPDIINVPEAWSDTVIKKYLTMSQSFFVAVDIPYIVTKKLHLRHSSMPGMFTSYTDPVYPLMVGYGRIAEYWKVLEDGFWSVTVRDSYSRNYIVANQPDNTQVNVNGHLVSACPFRHGRGHLLEIGGYKTA